MFHRVRRPRLIPLMSRLHPRLRLRLPQRQFLRPRARTQLGCPPHTVGTAVNTKCSAATTSASLTRMLNMLLVTGRSAIAVTFGWRAVGNRRAFGLRLRPHHQPNDLPMRRTSNKPTNWIEELPIGRGCRQVFRQYGRIATRRGEDSG